MASGEAAVPGGRRALPQRVADLHPGQVLRRVRGHGHREAGVDGPHRQVRARPHQQGREEAGQRPRRRLGARLGGHQLHDLQEDAVQSCTEKGKCMCSTTIALGGILLLQHQLLCVQHHCRKCGAVVCGPCSTQRFVLPSQSSKPLRVCSVCYEELSKSESRPPALQGERD